MNYNEVINYYNNTPKFSNMESKCNLQLKKLLEALGNPQKELKYIHIAGTNGKGSVSCMLSNALIAEGLKTGLYTSPHLESFNERIKINGKNIPDNELIDVTETVKSTSEKLNLNLSYFEKITAGAFLYFSKKKCDIVVLEAGLGGRLDATNIITPKISVITKISLDHTEVLGKTISKIAYEKCGIIKPNIPVITTKHQPTDALEVIKNVSKKNNSKLILGDTFSVFDLSLKGEYQKENAELSYLALKELKISDDSIKYSLKNSFWPARFEFIKPNLLLDGGHNPDGILSLLISLKELNKPVKFVIAMMQDKNYKESAKLIREFGGDVIVTNIDNPRCLPADILGKEFVAHVIINNPISAIQYALNSAKNDEIVCALGSLYFVGEVRRKFL